MTAKHLYAGGVVVDDGVTRASSNRAQHVAQIALRRLTRWRHLGVKVRAAVNARARAFCGVERCIGSELRAADDLLQLVVNRDCNPAAGRLGSIRSGWRVSGLDQRVRFGCSPPAACCGVPLSRRFRINLHPGVNMNAIRQALASALIKLGKWIQPQVQAGPVGEDPK